MDTSVHWHGVALRNDMDGVPGITQAQIRAGDTFSDEFTVPDAGTYFYHPHSGSSWDRGLYGVLVVDDPHEPGDYDHEWVVLLDDWVDGTGRTPDAVLRQLNQGERVRLRFTNMSMMFHPMHIHGHTFALVNGGARKDTVIVSPMQAVEVDLEANNPGQWAAHCHNIYHAETGMMTTLFYRA